MEIEKILISTQHADGIDSETLIKPDLFEHVLRPVLPAELYDEKKLMKNFFVNPTGRFVIGGPMGDCGLTGRKIIVDTYGGMARHGGGAFSGKDPSKVDRSAAYAARWVAKNIVAAGLADRAEVQVAYAIGVAHPVSVMVETFGTEKIGRGQIAKLVDEHFDLRPGAFREELKLHRPIYQKTAAYGHFGREDHDFTWEKTDKAEALAGRRGPTGLGCRRLTDPTRSFMRCPPVRSPRSLPPDSRRGGAVAADGSGGAVPGGAVAGGGDAREGAAAGEDRAGRADDHGARSARAVRLSPAPGVARRCRGGLDARGALRRAPDIGRRDGDGDRSEVSEEKLLSPVASPRRRRARAPLDLVALAEWLAEEYCSTLARALSLVLPPAATRRLSGRKRRVAPAGPTHVQVGARTARPPDLTAEQASAPWSSCATRSPRDQSQTRLLAGITGSGKTEVYLRIAAEALARGQGAIVLVPEIALTPQIVGRFIERFGDTVAVLHSRLTVGQRREQWRRLRVGEARVCVGPRSAVFAPIERLGLIVVDEEHDSSYKHEGDPRYDARTVAARRAERLWRAALARQRHAAPGEHPRGVGRRRERQGEAGAATLRAPATACDGSATAWTVGRCRQVNVLDMREQHGLHPLTSQALAEVRSTRGKAIVLLNRRGWSNFLTCRSCGRVWGCPQCDVALVLHRAGPATTWPATTAATTSTCRVAARVARPRSRVTEPGPSACNTISSRRSTTAIFRSSASTPIPSGGVGTDGAGEPERRGKRRRRTAARRFQDAPAGVLIGTQMVAKGHDFPDVALGVVLDADATLRFPDFRAEERTFALVCQLAGRVGRGREGHVLVQTMAPRSSLDPPRRRPRQRRFPHRRVAASPRARLSTLFEHRPGRVCRHRYGHRRGVHPRPRCRRGRSSQPDRLGGRRPRSRQACFACVAASARSWWSRPRRSTARE